MKQYLAPKWLFSTAVLFIFLLWILSVFWSFEPDLFEPELLAQQQASQRNESVVAGYTITTSLIKVSETLLNKSGGYLSNDVLPPSVMMDNMPSWEFGALEMTRDLALAMRQDFSRSQSQSLENPFLTKAQPQFNIDSLSWFCLQLSPSIKKALIIYMLTEVACLIAANNRDNSMLGPII